METMRAGVVTLEIEVAKPLSHHKGVAVELAWFDMLSLPLSGDVLTVDRAELTIVSGPASDETILDAPNGLQDFTWKCRYDNDEWMSADSLIKMLRNDPKVLSAKALK